jgi:hypothetical protein
MCIHRSIPEIFVPWTKAVFEINEAKTEQKKNSTLIDHIQLELQGDRISAGWTITLVHTYIYISFFLPSLFMYFV